MMSDAERAAALDRVEAAVSGHPDGCRCRLCVLLAAALAMYRMADDLDRRAKRSTSDG